MTKALSFLALEGPAVIVRPATEPQSDLDIEVLVRLAVAGLRPMARHVFVLGPETGAIWWCSRRSRGRARWRIVSTAEGRTVPAKKNGGRNG